jgi:hypothetical protein
LFTLFYTSYFIIGIGISNQSVVSEKFLKLKYPAKVMGDCVESKGTIACDIPK